MSMHLCGPALTTTSYKKRKQKVTKAQQEELERGWRERNVRLKQMGLSKETFEQYMEWVYGKGKKTKGQKNPGKKVTEASSSMVTCAKETTGNKYSNNKETDIRPNSTPQDKMVKETVANRIWTTGACKTKQTPTYTGSKIIGIAVLHKSCLQPVFSQEEAIDVARMRR
jgi:hypothetical protein